MFTKIGIDELEAQFEKQIECLKTYLNQVDKDFNKSQEILKLQHIGVILIFIAHATISDSTRELQSSLGDNTLTLNEVFKQTLPSKALKQVANICLNMVDRIISVPSEWIKSVTLLVLWFSLHTDDGLVDSMFELCPIL